MGKVDGTRVGGLLMVGTWDGTRVGTNDGDPVGRRDALKDGVDDGNAEGSGPVVEGSSPPDDPHEGAAQMGAAAIAGSFWDRGEGATEGARLFVRGGVPVVTEDAADPDPLAGALSEAPAESVEGWVLGHVEGDGIVGALMLSTPPRPLVLTDR